MAAGVSDGAIIIDTGIDNSGITKDSRVTEKLVNGLKNSVDKAGQAMAEGVNAYARAMERARNAAKALAGDQAAISKEIDKTESALARMEDRRDKMLAVSQRQLAAQREQLRQQMEEELKSSIGYNNWENMPEWSQMQAMNDYMKDFEGRLAAIQGQPIENSKAWQSLQYDIEQTTAKLEALRAELSALEGTASTAGDVTEAMNSTVEVASESLAKYARLMNEWSDTIRDDSWSDTAINDESAMLSITRYINEAVHERELAYSETLTRINETVDAMEAERAEAEAVASAEQEQAAATEEAAAASETQATATEQVAAASEAQAQASEHAADAERDRAAAEREAAGAARAAAKSNNVLGVSFKNMLKYGLGIRSMFVLFNRLRAAVKEGFGELRKQSPEVDKALTDITGAFKRVKASLATALAPLLTALAPVITRIANLLTRLFNTIGMVFAAITGQKYYYAVVVDGMNEIGDSANAATNEVKALERQLASFDELNILSKNKSSGSSGSGSDDTSDVQFEKRMLEGFWATLSEKIRKLKEAFESVKQWIDDMDKKLAGLWDSFFNGGKEFLQDPLGWVDRHIGQPIITGVKKIFGINSPSTEMENVGYYITLGLKQGMINGLGNIDQWLKINITDPIMNAFNRDWGTKTLEFTVGTNVDANTLYKLFKTAWERETRSLSFTVGTNQTANELYNSFSTAWDRETRSIMFTPGVSLTASKLYKSFETAWDRETRALDFVPATSMTASELYETFTAAWDRVTRSLSFTPVISMTAERLYELFNEAWGRDAKVLNFIPGIVESAGELYNSYVEEWGTRTLLFTVGTNVTAQRLFELFDQAWGTRVLTVKIDLAKDWSTITDYINQNFGGATGGGGQTSGGGAGRYTVSVVLKEPTSTEVTGFCGRLKEAWDASVVAVNKGLDVIVRPVASASGQALKDIVGAADKLKTWLFGSANTPRVDTKIDAKGGAGFQDGVGYNGKLSLVGVNCATAQVDGVPGAGFKEGLSGTNTYTLKGIEPAKATVNLAAADWGTQKGLQNWFKSVFKSAENPFVTMIGNLTSSGANWSSGTKSKSGLQTWFEAMSGAAVDMTSNLVKGKNTKIATVYKWLGTAKGILTLTLSIAGKAWETLVSLAKSAAKKKNGLVIPATITTDTSASRNAASQIEFHMPAMASGTVLPYDVSAQIAKTGQDIMTAMDANNEDLIQTIISVAGQIVNALGGLRAAPAVGGVTAQQVINALNQRTQMFGESPLQGV